MVKPLLNSILRMTWGKQTIPIFSWVWITSMTLERKRGLVVCLHVPWKIRIGILLASNINQKNYLQSYVTYYSFNFNFNFFTIRERQKNDNKECAGDRCTLCLTDRIDLYA